MGKTVLFVESRKEITLNLRRVTDTSQNKSKKKNELSMGNWKLMVRSFLLTFSLFLRRNYNSLVPTHPPTVADFNSVWIPREQKQPAHQFDILSWSEKVYDYIDSSTRKLVSHYQCSCFRDFENCNTVPLLHNSLVYSHRVLCLSLTEA